MVPFRKTIELNDTNIGELLDIQHKHVHQELKGGRMRDQLRLLIQ